MPRPQTSSEEVDRLEQLGLALLANRAFYALRGPRSRGAVPVEEIAEGTGRARATVSRIAAREIGRETATPFDLVARRVMDPAENLMQVGWSRAVTAFAQNMQAAEPGASLLNIALETISGVLAEEFDGGGSPERRQMLVVGYLLHAAALASDTEDGADPALRDVLGWRRASYTQSMEIHASALRFLLAQAGRRPKPCYTDAAIVSVLHALFDGYMLMHLLDRDAYPLALMRKTILDLGNAMTEPGVFAHRWAKDDPAPQIIEAALKAVKATQKLIQPGDAAVLAGYLPEVGVTAFPDSAVFAEQCIEAALRPQAVALRDLGAGIEHSAYPAAVRLLETIEQIADDLRPMVDIVSAAPVWLEVEQLLAQLLRVPNVTLSIPGDPAGAAKILVVEARRGSEGHNTWVAALGMHTTEAGSVPGSQL